MYNIAHKILIKSRHHQHGYEQTLGALGGKRNQKVLVR